MMIVNTKEMETEEWIKNEKIVEEWWTLLEKKAEEEQFHKKKLHIMIKPNQISSYIIRELDLEERWTQDRWA